MKRALPTLLVVLATAVIPASAVADALDPRVMVLPVEGEAPAALGALSDDVAASLVSGAERTTSTVAQATASLSDTAAIVGCEPSLPTCRDAVAAALNVDQLLLARIDVVGADAAVEVTAVTREGEPVMRTFPVRVASRADDLAALEREVPIMLEAGEARRGDGDGVRGADRGGSGTGTSGAGVGVAVRRDGGRARSRAPLIVTASGAVVVALGGVSWALASAMQSDIDEAPVETAADLDRLAALEDGAALRATVGNVLVAAGAVTVGIGVVWWLVDRGTSDDAPAVSVGPAVFARGGGLAVGGRW